MAKAKKKIEPLAYRVKQVAELLNLSPSTIHDLLRRRVIESVRIGKGRRQLILIPAAAVQKLLDQHRVPARESRRPGLKITNKGLRLAVMAPESTVRRVVTAVDDAIHKKGDEDDRGDS